MRVKKRGTTEAARVASDFAAGHFDLLVGARLNRLDFYWRVECCEEDCDARDCGYRAWA
jgi:hypothetical protein